METGQCPTKAASGKIGPAVPRTTSEDGVAHTSETSGSQPLSNVAQQNNTDNPCIRHTIETWPPALCFYIRFRSIAPVFSNMA